jgi:4-amino-4-deoxy-L-arabinose transferase-like glycosyltransferase
MVVPYEVEALPQKNTRAQGVGAAVKHLFETNPSRLFWIFAGIHFVLWTLVPTLVTGNAPLDVIEGYAWGHEWQLGTYKHPPMQAWVLELAALITGRAPWAHYLVSQICVITTFWAVWKTSERIAGPQKALIGVLMLEGIVYYNFTSPEFNPNLLQLPLWALTGMYFHRAVRENRISDWLLVGLWGAAGMYSKYSTIVLLVALTLLMVIHPESRKRWTSAGPYLAIATLLLLFAPHLVWLSEHDYLPFTYVKERLASEAQETFFQKWVVFPVLFLVNQTYTLLPVVVMYLTSFAFGRLDRGTRYSSFDRAFVLTMNIGPVLLALALCLARGCKLHDMWATPFWSFIPLAVMMSISPAMRAAPLRRFAYSSTIISFIMLGAYGGSVILYPYLTHKTQRVNFPGHEVAERINSVWDQHTDEPMKYVVGDVWLTGNLAYYQDERPHVVIKNNFTVSPWVTADDVKKNGGVLIWCIQYCIGRGSDEAMPDWVHDYPADKVAIQDPIVLPRLTGAKLPPVRVGWAILSPANPTP